MKRELSHYSSMTVDIEYEFLRLGRASRNCLPRSFDLDQHIKFSAKNAVPRPETNEIFVPHVVEPAWGLTRSVLTVLVDAFEEEELEG